VIAEWQEKIEEIEYWFSKFPLAEKDTEEADLLYRLLTYPDMKNVWSRLPKYKIKPSHLSNMTLLSCHYPYYSPSNLAPKNHQIWLEEVTDTASKLAKLIEYSEFDRILDAQYYKKRDKYLIKDMMSHALQILRLGIEKDDIGEAESSRWPDLSLYYSPTLLTILPPAYQRHGKNKNTKVFDIGPIILIGTALMAPV
jgi:hypothetical protein